jgi:hypothetical protein
MIFFSTHNATQRVGLALARRQRYSWRREMTHFYLGSGNRRVLDAFVEQGRLSSRDRGVC